MKISALGFSRGLTAEDCKSKFIMTLRQGGLTFLIWVSDCKWFNDGYAPDFTLGRLLSPTQAGAGYRFRET